VGRSHDPLYPEGSCDPSHDRSHVTLCDRSQVTHVRVIGEQARVSKSMSPLISQREPCLAINGNNVDARLSPLSIEGTNARTPIGFKIRGTSHEYSTSSHRGTYAIG